MTNDLLNYIKADKRISARYEMFNFMILYDKLCSESENKDSKVVKFMSKVLKKLNNYIVFDEKTSTDTSLENFIKEGIRFSLLGDISNNKDNEDNSMIETADIVPAEMLISQMRFQRCLKDNHWVQPLTIGGIEDKEFIMNHLNVMLSEEYEKGKIFDSLFYNELKVLCIEWIAAKCCSETKDIPENIFFYQPKENSDYQHFVINLIWRIQLDISNSIRMLKGMDAEMADKIRGKDVKIESLEKELNESKSAWEKERTELESSTKRLKGELKDLEDRLTQRDKNKISMLEEENRRLNSQLLKERRLNEQLKAKFETDSSNKAEEMQESIDDIEEEKADPDLPYIFVIDTNKAGSHTILLNAISNRFPNSRIMSAKTFKTITQLKTEHPVVCMTNYISHSSYYSVKKKCDSAGVSFIHCDESGISAIERELLKKGYKS